MTTNDGRFSFSDPSPYDSQAPRDGRPGSSAPVSRNVTAGAWLMASVYIDLTNTHSSAIDPVCGRKSASLTPALPWVFQPVMPGSRGRFFCPAVMVVSRWPMLTDGGSSCPRRLYNSGLWSNRSTCDGAPP